MQTTAASHETSPATVYVVDDDAETRTALACLLQSAGWATITCGSASEFLQRYDARRSGCLLLDVRMPGMSGLELQQLLSSQSRSPPIIFITAYGDVPVVTQAIRGGAVDVLLKPFEADTLLNRVREAIQHDAENRLRQEQIEQVVRCVRSLTEREQEVMYHLAAGESAKEIAQRLDISPKTVDNHRAKILEKMLVDNPTQLARKLALLRPNASAPFPVPAVQASPPGSSYE